MVFYTSNNFRFFAIPQNNDLVAQPVEQLTLNQWVESSILSQVTFNIESLRRIALGFLVFVISGLTQLNTFSLKNKLRI